MKLRINKECSIELRTCKICNIITKSLTALSAHVYGKHKLKSKEYYNLYLKSEEEGLCLYCKKPTSYRNYHYFRFCSNSCADNYNYMNSEYKQKHKDLYDDNIKQKMSEKRLKYFENEENKKNLSKTIKNYYKNNENREKTANAVKKSIKEGKLRKRYIYNDKIFQSYYELSFYIWLKEHKIRFEYLQNVSFNYIHNNITYSYFPDFKVFNTYVEIKGLHFFENHDPNRKMINPYDRSQDAKYEAKHQCMIKNKVHIITDCSKYVNYVENKYGKDFKHKNIYRK